MGLAWVPIAAAQVRSATVSGAPLTLLLAYGWPQPAAAVFQVNSLSDLVVVPLLRRGFTQSAWSQAVPSPPSRTFRHSFWAPVMSTSIFAWGPWRVMTGLAAAAALAGAGSWSWS